jgi:hypothetical protein
MELQLRLRYLKIAHVSLSRRYFENSFMRKVYNGFITCSLLLEAVG